MFSDLYFRLCRKLCRLANDAYGVERWTNQLESRRVLSILKKNFDPNIPPIVQIEVTTACNYKCPFCPQSIKPRPVLYMTDDAFDRLIGRLEKIEFASPLNLSVNNEPFLHPHLLDFCRQISERLPKAQVNITTNGSLITDRHLDVLSSLAHPPSLLINDYTPNRSVSKHMSRWLEKSAPRTIATYIVLRSWNEKLSNRAGNHPCCDANLSHFENVICTWPFVSMYITADMKAFFCCADYNHEMIMGDLDKQDLMEIWNGEPYRRAREQMLTTQRRNITLCSRCNDIHFRLFHFATADASDTKSSLDGG